METLSDLYRKFSGAGHVSVAPLGPSGSHRKYYRLSGGCIDAIGVEGTSVQENRAFLAMASHFRNAGLNVPEVYAVSDDGKYYLQQDLGQHTLYDLLSESRRKGRYSPQDEALLIKTVKALPGLQFKGAMGFDFDVCYPYKELDSRQVMADLNYFKYCYLKLTGLEFDAELLEDDFEKLRDAVLAEDTGTFLYRDFQARNVMILDGEPYFIDFQGGYRGPVQYDLASFVWQARAAYPDDLRERMIDGYLEAYAAFAPVDRAAFRERLRTFALFRMLQVLGAYGFRGYIEGKQHFVESVPYALVNIRKLLSEGGLPYKYLASVLERISEGVSLPSVADDGRLEVEVYSFSYRKGVPRDYSGNGGGYVFDCRGTNNPGRYEQYRQLTGLDDAVIRFLEDDGGILRFLDNVYGIVDPHVECFINRGFTHLSVCFGCTGGQHRSVYSAEHFAEHIAAKFGKAVKVKLIHRERGIERLIEP